MRRGAGAGAAQRLLLVGLAGALSKISEIDTKQFGEFAYPEWRMATLHVARHEIKRRLIESPEPGVFDLADDVFREKLGEERGRGRAADIDDGTTAHEPRLDVATTEIAELALTHDCQHRLKLSETFGVDVENEQVVCIVLGDRTG